MRDTTVTPHFFGVTSELSRVLHYYTKFRLSGNGGNSFFFYAEWFRWASWPLGLSPSVLEAFEYSLL
ncbi:protein of unknown function [Kyrpidia spormannii]|uniref:Uncharacterized protein n=1 Tax=Kyrpidia spormannii TaxID=2055160 RepID=A0ACA8ZCC0_9BACL|nr:protein of unknown function [Kyrpidia spormannii]